MVQTTMSEELPREEGLPEESEESERWISDLFSARTDEATPREDTLRVCATCRRSLDKLNFSRTQWNKKQVGVSRCWECVSSDLEAPERSQAARLCYPEAARARLARRNEDYDAEAAASPGPEEKRDGRVSCCPVCGDPGWMSPGCPGCHHPGGRPGQRTAAQRHNKEERTVPCCYVFLCVLLECLECACFFCWLTS